MNGNVAQIWSLLFPLLIVGGLLTFIWVKRYRKGGPEQYKSDSEEEKPRVILPVWFHYLWRCLFSLSILGIFYLLFNRISSEDNKIIFLGVLVIIVLVGNLLYLTSLSGDQKLNYLVEIKSLLEASSDHCQMREFQEDFNQSQLGIKIRFKKWIITVVFSFFFFIAVIFYLLTF